MKDEVVKVLSEDLEAVEAEGPRFEDRDLRMLYEAMLLTRSLDERCQALHREGNIGFYVAASGLEATSLGAAFAMAAGDWVFPSHRDPGMFLMRGGSVQSWIDQLYGNANDLLQGRQLPNHHSLPGGRFISISGSVGAQIVHAAGCGVAMKARGDRGAVLVSFGDAAASQGGFHTGLNFAGVFGAPVVFLCQHRQRVPDSVQLAPRVESLAAKAVAYGFGGARVDGTDLLAVIKVVSEARERAAEGAGPTLIESVLPAAGGGDDPLSRLRSYLELCGLWDAAWEEELSNRRRQLLETAVTQASSTPEPAPESMIFDVYAEPPWMLLERRAMLVQGGERGDGHA
jgi:2-oxoisovalerate dehydrogenase E1 component alpha subunit